MTPKIVITPLAITGVQFALLTAISNPNNEKDSESLKAWIPNINKPMIPSANKIVPAVFIIICFC